MTGEGVETSRAKQVAFEGFATVYPVEAHEQDPDAFWAYFHRRRPHICREEMIDRLKWIEAGGPWR